VYVVKNEDLHGTDIKTRIEGLVTIVSNGTRSLETTP
jgi:hypothetical protein